MQGVAKEEKFNSKEKKITIWKCSVMNSALIKDPLSISPSLTVAPNLSLLTVNTFLADLTDRQL